MSARRTFLAVRSPMFIANTDADLAVGLAHAEDVCGRLVSVCSWCVSQSLRDALLGLENVSHGVCPGCAERELRELAAMKNLPVSNEMDAVPIISGAKGAIHGGGQCARSGAKPLGSGVGL